MLSLLIAQCHAKLSRLWLLVRNIDFWMGKVEEQTILRFNEQLATVAMEHVSNNEQFSCWLERLMDMRVALLAAQKKEECLFRGRKQALRFKGIRRNVSAKQQAPAWEFAQKANKIINDTPTHDFLTLQVRKEIWIKIEVALPSPSLLNCEQHRR